MLPYNMAALGAGLDSLGVASLNEGTVWVIGP
jgi:hypothetical protein